VRPATLYAVELTLIPALFFCFGLAIGIRGWRVLKGTLRSVVLCFSAVCCLIAVYVCVLTHRELIDARYRTYNELYHDIHTGMTREEVFRTVERRYPANGPRKKPRIGRDSEKELYIFMDPEMSVEPNCEGILLRLDAGRVTDKEYSPD
jgi:hypothetical protein